MSRISFFLGVFILPFALISIQAQPGPRWGTAAVSGMVTLKGEPAPGVTVRLVEQHASLSNFYSVSTDENGRFSFERVAGGKYRIFARAPGYISRTDNDWGLNAPSLNVVEGGKIENLGLEIKRGGVIAGRITDSEGVPVAESNVGLSRFDKEGRLQAFSFFYDGRSDMFQTDDRGVYRIYGLPEGRYQITAAISYPDRTIVSKAREVEVTEGAESANIDIIFPHPRERRGRN
jgi:hypothetical protein